MAKRSFVKRSSNGEIEVKHKANPQKLEVLRYAIISFGFLLPRGKTMSLAAFSYLIEEHYAGGTRIKECLSVLRSV